MPWKLELYFRILRLLGVLCCNMAALGDSALQLPILLAPKCTPSSTHPHPPSCKQLRLGCPVGLGRCALSPVLSIDVRP